MHLTSRVSYALQEFPGSWGSTFKVGSIDEVRNKLAVLKDWKKIEVLPDGTINGLVVRKYKVVKDLPTRKGTVGEQLDDITGELLNGGAEQLEFLEDLSKGKWKNYLDENNVETAARTPRTRYNQCKLIFDVASFFFGVGEAKTLLKTGKLSSNMARILAGTPSNVSKLLAALPGKLKKLQNNVLAYVLNANTYIEIARFTDDGVLIAKKWVDEPVEIVENIGEVTYKKTDEVAEATGEIGIVKDTNGGYGLGFVDEAVELVRGVLKNDFMDSVTDFANNPRLANEAWELFKNENWSALENFIISNNINGKWPPNFGFANITKREMGTELNGKIFDRFQKKNSLEGSYASPVSEGSIYTLASRALGVNYDDLVDLGQSYYYFKFKIINATDDISIDYGDAIPWFNEIGGATQVKTSKRFEKYLDKIDILEKWEFKNGVWTQID